METLTRCELGVRRSEMVQRILEGGIFIHPTDTIYGLGCDATSSTAVKNLRKLKERPEAPFSVWAPSKEWIRENFEMNSSVEKWVNEFPGPYTLILKVKKKVVAKNVHPGDETIGVRIPNHWFSEFVVRLGVPIVTTSANKIGRMFMTSLEDLDPEIMKGVRFAIYEGVKKGKPSKIVNLAEGGAVTER